ncbi:MAG: hypothetical protein GX282_00375 [Campylobacteraceae bacterium]|nr:hypothetical protein [Campylobacteraceae bacterium]
MSETYSMALNLHLVFYDIFLALSVIYLLFTQLGGGVKMVKRVRLLLPLYSSILAAMIFMGVLVLSMLDFKMTLSYFVMIVSSIAIIILIAKNSKALKKAYYTKTLDSYKKLSRVHLALIFFFVLIPWLV